MKNVILWAIFSTALNAAMAGSINGSFTYQGELQDGTVLADGAYDLTFELFDAAQSGTSMSTQIMHDDVIIAAGVFSVELDFGSSVFDGEQLWLEIGVRDGGSTGLFTTLEPRQKITATPYALHAEYTPFSGNTELLDGIDSSQFASQTDINNLQSQIDALTNQAAPTPKILGRSAQSSNGRFSFGGATGIRAADAMCQSTFPSNPTAHLCTTHEVTRSLANGNYENAASINNVATWTVAPTFGHSTTPDSSLFNNCQNLLYNSADTARGTQLTVNLGYTSNGNGGGLTGDVFRIERGISCGSNMPVLCCE